jgi:hypothetical protein
MTNAATAAKHSLNKKTTKQQNNKTTKENNKTTKENKKLLIAIIVP